MKKLSKIAAVVSFAAISFGLPSMAQQTAPAPDNTKMNREAQPTADQAKNNKSDVQIMADIRRAVVKDSSLSTYAHNVKIVASHGKVTLRGPVRSDEEKKSIEDKAVQVAGSGNVNNMLSVKAKK